MIPPISLPTVAELAPWLERLTAHPGSLVFIAVEIPDGQNFARVSWGHFTADERRKFKHALRGINRSRRNRGESTTEERP